MRRLDSLCKVIFTGLPPRLKANATDSSGSVPLVGIKSITPDGELNRMEFEEFLISGSLPSSAISLEEGDVILSIRGSLPKCTFVEQPFSTQTFASGNLAVIRPDSNKLCPSFLWSVLFHITQNERHPLLSRATTQQLSIRIGDLHALKIPSFSIDQQQAIGNASIALRNVIRAQRKVLGHAERTMSAFLADTLPII